MHPDKSIVGIFAKRPMRGQAKTRLASDTSPAWAEQVASAFLEDTLDRFASLEADKTIVFAPNDGGDFFERLAKGRYTTMPQSNGDLGQRLRAFFTHVQSQGYSRVVVIGTDSPTLPVDHVENTLRMLAWCDVVIGPAIDGGYTLIGTSCASLVMFDDIPWSTSRVLETTIARIHDTSLRLALLPPWYDVDTLDDWHMLHGHVRAMRQAGIDPGTPRVERLIEEEP
jgi:rSAM/selenodomain-associated transferase 1